MTALEARPRLDATGVNGRDERRMVPLVPVRVGRREVGLLRIVGMTDGRVQRMVRLESMLIAALGTVTGPALGVFVGWGLIGAIDRLSEAGLSVSLPVRMLVLVLVAGVLPGFLASLIPARLEVLQAVRPS